MAMPPNIPKSHFLSASRHKTRADQPTTVKNRGAPLSLIQIQANFTSSGTPVGKRRTGNINSMSQNTDKAPHFKSSAEGDHSDEIPIELLNPSITALQRVELAAEYILSGRAHKQYQSDKLPTGDDNDKGHNGTAIVEMFSELSTIHNANNESKIVEISGNTFRQYLSTLASSSTSRISRIPGSYGYIIKDLVQSETSNENDDEAKIQEAEVTAPDASPNARVEREKALYPLLVSWLSAEKHCMAKDVSATRKQGIWGNPDVLGVKIHETYSGEAIELISIEVKPSVANWGQYFFEAVSHRRFCDRAYFCYAIAVGSKTPADLSYYSELFNVGVIEVRFSTEAYKTFIDDGTVDPDYVEVREIFNAPRVPPPEELKHSFMRGLEIDKKKSLYHFGLTT